MGKMDNHVKIINSGKRRNFSNIPREASPQKVTFLPELIYEEDVHNSTAQSEGGRRIRNEQLKNAWLKNEKVEAAGILFGDRP